MMLNEIDKFLLEKEGDVRDCLKILREYILKFDKNIAEAWKFNMPSFSYKGERFCYLSVYKKSGLPYLGFIEGKRINNPYLILGDHARIKILPLDPTTDLPLDIIDSVLKSALALYY